MKYLCLAYYDPDKFDALTREQLDLIIGECRPLDEALQATGAVDMVASLAAPKDSVSIRPRGGRPTVTDGPYVETKEALGSFFLIEAADLNEAVRIASMHPAARLGEERGWGVEVRPIEFCRAATRP